MNVNPSAEGHDFFIQLVLGYRSAKVVQVAHMLGVFPLLEGQGLTADAVASALKTDTHATTVLLRALAALELLSCTKGEFTNAPKASNHLLPGKPGYLGANLKYQELLWEGWSSLQKTVETGEPRAGLVELLSEPSFVGDYLRSVENVSRASAQELGEILSKPAPRRMLDVGSGLGTYSATFAAMYPQLRATLLDLGPSLALAKKSLEGAEVFPRLDFREGNYHHASFGDGYDLVLFSHVTHDESPEANARLMKKAFAALNPGGAVAIHDFVVRDDGCGPLFAALFSVNMLVYTRGGQVYSELEYRQMLEGAGFGEVSATPILAKRTQHGSRLIVGRKPA